MIENSLRFYFTKDKNGLPHHVVVTTGKEKDGKVRVARVGFHENAAVKRGRTPLFAKPQDISALQAIPELDVTDDMRKAAFAAVGVVDSEVN